MDQRYYAVGKGRFTTPDPYRASGGPADPGSWNRYAYVGGDPVNRYDPLGLDWWDPNTNTLYGDPVNCDFMKSLDPNCWNGGNTPGGGPPLGGPWQYWDDQSRGGGSSGTGEPTEPKKDEVPGDSAGEGDADQAGIGQRGGRLSPAQEFRQPTR